MASACLRIIPSLIFAVLSIVVATVALQPSHARPAQCSLGWNIVPGPSAKATGYAFGAIAAVAPDDVWAVGNFGPYRAGHTLTAHWDGQSWSLVPSPSPGTDGHLVALDVIATDDIWAVGYSLNAAVGYSLNADGAKQPLALHWDGKIWSAIPSLAPNYVRPGSGSRNGNSLTAVSAVSHDDVWAVGQYTGYKNRALAMHWNGKVWSFVPTPDPGGLGESLLGVSAASHNDVWAVGDYSPQTGGGGGTRSAMMLHWDGISWSVVTLDVLRSYLSSYLTAVEVVAANDIWVAAGYSVGRGVQTIMLHWDGNTWTRVTSPNLDPTGITDTFVEGLSATAPDDIWAVGYYRNDTERYALTLHWDGDQWSLILPPKVGLHTSSLHGVIALGPNNIWAVGDASSGPSNYTLAVQYNKGCLGVPVPDPRETGVHWFSETGHTLRGDFLSYWEKYGGLAQFGYPITEEFTETLGLDNKEYKVQYFQRNRFERHAENADPRYKVLIGALGRDFHAADPSTSPIGGSIYFRETGHNLSSTFKEYWETHGGLFVHGYPITERLTEKSPTDGKTYEVQYFERSRLEYHPENAGSPHEVLLGLLGVQLAQRKGYLP
jgi:hypothetical protein